jgi:hypothetical protein
VAALITQGMLDLMTNPATEFIDPTSNLPDLQKTWGAALIGFWIVFSTIAAPVIIQKVISSGVLAGSELLSGGARVAIQTATSAVSGAVAAAPLGPIAAVAAGGAAGGLTMLSASSGTGHAGSMVASLGGLAAYKNDPTGQKTVYRLLSQLARGGLPPIFPK